jgi:hypothetical protein
VSNIFRITVTGVLYDMLGNGFGGAFFHDLAGWLMMPLGLVFLGLELLILRKLLCEAPAQQGLATLAALQQVNVNPVALYRGGNSSRRQRRTVAVPQTQPATPVEAPAEAAPESLAQS